eukprot:CAMPEP_0202362238 /NCGR_PEP_ID=MMETSP1126-20121109/14484_1 /ASSEMBLY_ACC=CAM_ASM_000457 /TAXON_ID=3047 /ORGANISM="Dunaliella tertiolecta, Strain CCMP1320" /LENGTH=128 /DNA_ID=CAMNT_0048956357 /DNA_START=473 /DNA_END=860 /DNA_ORIENTATION=+
MLQPINVLHSLLHIMLTTEIKPILPLLMLLLAWAHKVCLHDLAGAGVPQRMAQETAWHSRSSQPDLQRRQLFTFPGCGQRVHAAQVPWSKASNSTMPRARKPTDTCGSDHHRAMDMGSGSSCQWSSKG